MRSVGYGPDNRLKVKVSTRNIAWYRDPAAILIDQLKEIWIDGELETPNWVPKLIRKDFTVVLSLSGSAVDDPDTQFYENYSCRSPRNYTGYCNPEVEALIDRQSAQSDPSKAQGTGLAGRAQIDRGCGAPDHLLYTPGDLLAARGQGPELDGQQHLQQLAHGGCLARPVTSSRASSAFDLRAPSSRSGRRTQSEGGKGTSVQFMVHERIRPETEEI
jgi:hypothetical protein